MTRQQIQNVVEKIKKSKFVRDFYSDLRSQRVIWTWIAGMFFIYVSTYALKHYPEAAVTVVQVAGAFVSLVFAGYVFSKSSENKIRAMNGRADDSNIEK